jgi:hypothetical protein
MIIQDWGILMRKVVSIGVIGLLAGVAMVVQPVSAAAVPDVACTVAGPNPARLDMTRAADGAPAYTKWLEQIDIAAANTAIQNAVHAEFGVDTGKEGVGTLARRGYLGSAVDHNTRTLVTVVTPEYRANAAALKARIAAALPATVNRTYKTAVIVGCHSGARIAAAADLLQARAWHPDAAKASFGFSLDASDSRLYVSFDPAFASAADAARAAFGDVAVVTLGGSSRAGRLDDGEPHWGGAGVRVGSGGITTNTCTTTFIVRRNSDGRRGGLSAGHCFTNGNSIYSSTQFWGTAWGEYDYPRFDMIGIASAGETYDNRIHVDPCCPSVRDVTSRRHPAVNDSVCLSGMVTRAVCGLIVNNLFATFCDEAGCTPGLMQMRRANDVTGRRGDSGGPVYMRTGPSTAAAMGLIVAATDGGRNVLAEKLGSFESHLGVTVITS